MQRTALETLKRWKARAGRKPLIIHGARQVGKTWLMKEFGKREYRDAAYIVFEKNPRMKALFEGDTDTRRLLLGLELETGKKINPKDTLIIFDEIQECPDALTALKYFNENNPEYDILAAGSLLGAALHGGISFPVGNVEFLNLYPLGFEEFLFALGEERLAGLAEQRDWELVRVFKDKFTSYLKTYYITGGMPEAVQSFSGERDFTRVREIQKNILVAYEQDFSRHIPLNLLPRVQQLWASIPSQLARENKKFIFRELQKGATASMYEIPLGRLESCGLVHKISRVSKPGLPLAGYKNSGAFKLFLSDVGLLCAMSGVEAKTILEGSALFTEFRGALTEQFVCQELKLLDSAEIAYWANEGATAELDFVLQIDGEIIPVEVKARINLKAKSLGVYREKFRPRVEVRTSLGDYKQTDSLFDIPLYAIGGLRGIVKGKP